MAFYVVIIIIVDYIHICSTFPPLLKVFALPCSSISLDLPLHRCKVQKGETAATRQENYQPKTIWKNNPKTVYCKDHCLNIDLLYCSCVYAVFLFSLFYSLKTAPCPIINGTYLGEWCVTRTESVAAVALRESETKTGRQSEKEREREDFFWSLWQIWRVKWLWKSCNDADMTINRSFLLSVPYFEPHAWCRKKGRDADGWHATGAMSEMLLVTQQRSSCILLAWKDVRSLALRLSFKDNAVSDFSNYFGEI